MKDLLKNVENIKYFISRLQKIDSLIYSGQIIAAGEDVKVLIDQIKSSKESKNNLIQLQKINSRLWSGQFISAWRENRKLISWLEKDLNTATTENKEIISQLQKEVNLAKEMVKETPKEPPPHPLKEEYLKFFNKAVDSWMKQGIPYGKIETDKTEKPENEK